MSTQMTEQLAEAGVLLVVGMSVVFGFLILLIAGVHTIAWYCRKFPGDEAPVQSPHKRVAQSQAGAHQHSTNKSSTSVSPQIAAAIAAAVNTHRHNTLKQ